MLYTVVPLERIYSYRTESILGKSSRNTENKEDSEVEYKQVELQHGRVYARRDGDNYVVDGICSTDMSDYLNNEYAPGAVLKL